MKLKMLIGAVALTLSGAAFAAETPALEKECCCKKDDDGKMACCKDKAKAESSEKSGYEGHDMSDMEVK